MKTFQTITLCQLHPISMSSIKIIFFDATGTLMHVYPSVWEVYARIGREGNIPLDAQRVEESFKRAFSHAPPLAFPTIDFQHAEIRLEAEKKWWSNLVREVVREPRLDQRAFQ